MFILYRYIALNVIRGFLFVALILVSLFAIILLIDELDDVGTGAYTWGLAIRHVLLHVPKLLIDFAAFISLVGAIAALGTLAGNQELVALESVGHSPKGVTRVVIATACLLMLVILLIAQFIIPMTLHVAHVEKTIATESFGDFVSDSGYWSQSQERFLHVQDIDRGRTPTGIEIYEFDNKHQLIRSMWANYADISDDNKWQLHEVTLREIVGEKLQIIKLDDLQWESFLSSAQLGVIVVKPEALSLTNLYAYVQGLKQRGEQSHRYELIFWQRVMNPVAAAIMIFLGLRFVFGSQRDLAMGKRITYGVLAGIGFYVVSQLTTHTGTLLKIAPLTIALIPSAVVLGLILVAVYSRKFIVR